ncbi:MAG: imelysin family protein [Pseudomonadota bacterium]
MTTSKPPARIQNPISGTIKRAYYPSLWIILLVLVLMTVGCTDKSNIENPASIADDARVKRILAEKDASLLAPLFWQQASRQLEETHQQIRQLQLSIEQLLDSPSKDSISRAKTQWLQALNSYYTLLPFLFLENGNNHSVFKQLNQWRFSLAAWPLQPAYLDSYDIYAHSGIVNDIALPITKSTLRKQHGFSDDQEVTLGLHAIETLLWAKSDKAAFKRFQAKHKVPLVLAQSGLQQNELPNNRRRQLLLLQSELLSDDSQSLLKQWQKNGLLHTAFEQLPVIEKVMVFKQSFQSCIVHLRDLLNHHNSNNSDNIPLDSFANGHRPSMSLTIDTLESLYFATTAGVDSAESSRLSLARILFNAQQQQQLAQSLNSLSTQMRNNSDTAPADIIANLNQVIALLSPDSENG